MGLLFRGCRFSANNSQAMTNNQNNPTRPLQGFFLAFALCVGVTACGDSSDDSPDATPMGDGGVMDAGPMMDANPPDAIEPPAMMVEDPATSFVAAREASVTAACSCDFEEFGFTSQEECVDYTLYLEENQWEGSTLLCADNAMESAESVWVEYSCLIAAELAYGECVAAAGCVAAARDACDTSADSAIRSCPSASDADEDLFFEELQSCVSGPSGGAACPPAATGSMTGLGVFTADTFEAGDDRMGSCGGEGAPDVTFVWEAPADGEYVIESFASRYDTVLYVLDGGCEGTMELACNDDIEMESDPLWTSAPGYQGGVIVTLVMGQTIAIVLDGYSGAAGSGSISIYESSELGDEG